jgi:hypothetical protein
MLPKQKTFNAPVPIYPDSIPEGLAFFKFPPLLEGHGAFFFDQDDPALRFASEI